MNTITLLKKACSFFIFLFLFTSENLFAQYDFKWQTDGPVYASQIKNNTLYIGGSFSYVGQYSGGAAMVDNVTGVWDQSWPKVNGYVFAILPDGNGGYYIGGNFTYVDNILRSGIAHILPDKTVDPNFNPGVAGTVCTMYLYNGNLYIGGTFFLVNGIVRQNLAAIDLSGNVLSLNVQVNASVTTLRVVNDIIYIGGTFTKVEAQDRNQFAAIDINGNLTTLDLKINSLNPSFFSVNALEAYGNILYIGGNGIKDIGGQSRKNLAALDIASGTITAWNPDPAGNVNCIKVIGSNLYVGGGLISVANQPVFGMAAFDLSSGSLLPWYPQIGGTVNDFIISGSLVYIGGNIFSVNGDTRNKLAAIDINTGLTDSWNPNAGNGYDVRALIALGNNIVAGGSFTSINGKNRNNAASIDLSANTLTNWNPDTDGPVYAMAVTSSRVYLGGQFSNISGNPRNYIGSVDPVAPGFPDNWQPDAGDIVRTIAVSKAEDIVYAGGDFTNIGGQARNYIAALDASLNVNNALVNWDAHADNTVRTLLVVNDTLYAGGDFSNIGGKNRNYIAALNGNGNSTGYAFDWDPNANASVYTLADGGGKIFAGGDFTMIGGKPRSKAAALDVVDNNATDWIADADATIRSIAVQDDVVYMGGDFTDINNSGQTGQAALDGRVNSNNVLPWGFSALGNQIFTVAISPDNIYLGGFYDYSSKGKTLNLGYVPPYVRPIILPTHFTQFTATKQSHNSLIQWQASDIDAGTTFEAQRRTSGASFTTIYTTSINSKTALKSFEVTDKDLKSGICFYRLKIKEPSGKITYSQVRSVSFDDQQVSAYPTALKRGEKMSVSVTEGHYELRIISITGQLISRQSLYPGNNVLNTANLTPGMYVYSIVDESQNVIRKDFMLVN